MNKELQLILFWPVQLLNVNCMDYKSYIHYLVKNQFKKRLMNNMKN